MQHENLNTTFNGTYKTGWNDWRETETRQNSESRQECNMENVQHNKDLAMSYRGGVDYKYTGE